MMGRGMQDCGRRNEKDIYGRRGWLREKEKKFMVNRGYLCKC